MSYFDETLKDWVKTQQAGLGTTRSMQKLFNVRNRAILDLIGAGVSRKNFQKVKQAVRKLDAKAKERLFKLIESQLADVANITIRNELGNMELLNITPTKTSLNTTGILRKALSEPMQATSKTVRQVMNDVFGASTEAATNIIRRSITEGLTGRQVRRVLLDRFNVDNRHLATVTATAMNSVANTARSEFYKANSDVIRGVMWRSTLDSRTSPYCQSMDGKIWEVDEPHPSPPAHPNCRSFLVPIVTGMTDKQARTMLRPSVAEGKAKRTTQPTYGEWLKRQSKGFQLQVLGKRRTELLRKGKVSFDRFTTTDGRLLTLKELEQRL